MSDARKKTNTTGTAGAVEQMADQATRNGQAPKLARMNAKLGNEELQQRIGQGNATRDQMLQFLCHRLNTLREVQLRELALCNSRSQRDWWRLVSDRQKSEFTKPEPTRWRESARLYEEAATQLCRGKLGRGTELLKQALAEEQRQFGSLTALVDANDVEQDVGEPEATAEVTSGQVCGACAVPDDVSLAREIQLVDKEMADPPRGKRRRDPWWTIEEEEEEEQGGGGDG